MFDKETRQAIFRFAIGGFSGFSTFLIDTFRIEEKVKEVDIEIGNIHNRIESHQDLVRNNYVNV